MKTFKYFYFLLAIFLFGCQGNDDQPTLDSKMAYDFTNVRYGSNPSQVFDLHLPANRSSNLTKTIIVIHGGGWVSGDKSDTADLLPFFAEYLPHYAIVNINYRLAAPGSPAFPKQLHDIQDVISKLKSGGYNISSKFALVGFSAGAHLAMLYGYAHDPDHEVKVVCSFVGPTNFTDFHYLSNPALSGQFSAALGQTYAQNPQLYRQLSPLFQATYGAPPTLLLYGNADPLVPASQGPDMSARLTELGVYNELGIYVGGHGDWVQGDIVNAYTRLFNFILYKLP